MIRSLCLAVALSLAAAPSPGDAGPPRSRLLQNTTGKTVIRKVILGNDETVAIVSRSGTAVLCDPQNMPPGVIPDLVTVTHDHHLNKTYMEEAKAARGLVQWVGSTSVGDVRVTGIASAHSDAPVRRERPDIVTYLFEVDGLRIAYFACNGQRQLEPEQLAALGKVDVALITAENEGSTLSVRRARELMKQLGAPIVVPLSHHSGDMEYDQELMAEVVGGQVETVNGELALTRAELGGKRQRLVHIASTLAP